MTDQELGARNEMVKYSHLVHREHLVTATDGNLSIRLDDRRILITPSNLRKEDMTIDAPVVIDYEGEVIEGDRRASSEKKIQKISPCSTCILTMILFLTTGSKWPQEEPFKGI